MTSINYKLENSDAIVFLQNNVEDNTIQLILTDPPYIISKKSGMQKHYDNIKNNIKSLHKTEEEWKEFCNENNIIFDDKNNKTKKENYLNYGTIYGKKYATKSIFGKWDQEFTLEHLEKIIELFYKKLKNGGYCIIFFDLWKITVLKELLEKYNFKQIRFIEWIKTNTQPINSKINYLSNCREIAITAVKGSKPIFNSSYDKGIYLYPIEQKNRTHPTQKNKELFKELINKHTNNNNDIVLDCFLGSGTTLFASLELNRNFIGCELDKNYFEIIEKRLNSNSSIS